MTVVTRRRLLAATAFVGCGVRAQGQPFPQRPVRIIVAFAPGGATDLIARLLAARLSESWGQPVIVDNRAGASGMVGTEFVARSAPDGYTLVLATQTTHATNPALHPKVPYDAQKDFEPVMLVGSTPLALLVHPSLPVQSVAELVAYLRQHPGKLSYAGGNGTSQHLSGELFKRLAGVDLVHVPYKGAAPGMADLLAGQVQLMFDNLPTALPHVRAGKLRGLAVTSPQRSSLAPNLPTLEESGLTGFAIETWFALFAPAGTTAPVVDRIHVGAARALAIPEVRDNLQGQGVEVVAGTPAQLATFHRSEMSKWARLVRDAGAKPD
jgi:tripartite-type tricarboxylate transporter receptor subunit TctC